MGNIITITTCATIKIFLVYVRFMPDDGTGEKKVWRIEDLALVEVPEAQVNNLYNGDCYVIQYTYGGGENIVYFWQGNNCTIDERGASALHAARTSAV